MSDDKKNLAFSMEIIADVQERAEDCMAKFCELNDVPELKTLIDQYAISNILQMYYHLAPDQWSNSDLAGIEALNQDLGANLMELTRAINQLNRLME